MTAECGICSPHFKLKVGSLQVDCGGWRRGALMDSVQCWWGHRPVAAIPRVALHPRGLLSSFHLKMWLLVIVTPLIKHRKMEPMRRRPSGSQLLVFSKQHLWIYVMTAHHLSPSECFPAGRRLVQLLQQPDRAAAEAERRADRVREPSDRGEERSQEPHPALGGGAAPLSAGWSGVHWPCRCITGLSTEILQNKRFLCVIIKK